MLIKGAPDFLFESVSHILNSDGTSVPFDYSHKARISALQSQWSSEGQRVLAICKCSLDGVRLSSDENEMEDIMYTEIQELTLVGLISIRDPLRVDVKDAVKVIRNAGVRVFMVTGAFMLTAVAIAKQVSHRLLSIVH
jgi:sodium/potassium-transporting ATPase subunit alpha